MRYVELTVCWLLKLNPGQLDRVSWCMGMGCGDNAIA